ncbi:MAG TPA: O-antigen ligase family protein [Thermoanaerobaculia bacterium]|nr:O-antigen ligase family protein [Thermoanaerobaculia bacterium]
MQAANARATRQQEIRQRSATAARKQAENPNLRGATWWLTRIVLAGMLLIPFAMSYAYDPFRYPKELLLRVEIIVSVVTLAVAWALGRLDLPRLETRSSWFRLTAIACGWTILCALLSTNRLVSIAPAVRVLEYALLFAIMAAILRGLPAWMAGIVVAPAAVNAAVYILQELEIWSPFPTNLEIESHLRRTALIGNPNDVGSYLVVPALTAAALAFAQRRWRAAWTAAAVFLMAGIVFTHTVAAIGAAAAGLAVMFALRLRTWRKITAVFAAAAIAGVAVVAAYPPLRERAALMHDAFAKRDYEAFTAGRTIPFLAAAAMVRDHPLTGVGPGCFAYHFFDYKIRLQERHRWMFAHATDYNFGEVHNDHLQVASETGLPGYAIFLAALVLLASASWRRRDAPLPEDERGGLVRMLALPLSTSMFVLALAQFPLELVATTHVYLWGAAAVTAWRGRP